MLLMWQLHYYDVSLRTNLCFILYDHLNTFWIFINHHCFCDWFLNTVLLEFPMRILFSWRKNIISDRPLNITLWSLIQKFFCFFFVLPCCIFFWVQFSVWCTCSPELLFPLFEMDCYLLSLSLVQKDFSLCIIILNNSAKLWI